ncbi:CGNR zinc finger domain-containing protein [Nonomuraea sp. M3C6]|uniref:CGNR zinc finger domain-containing protein n=1 Tax=Nonomuraea marmarensis TaxID=3351344 RepID=A0ABW7AMC7_9ACTN
MSISWPATGRYDLDCAPGGLGLVQDLLNTISAGVPQQPDLLADVESARTWVYDVTARWSAATGQPIPEVALDGDELQELRAFRDTVHRVTAAPADGSGPAVPHTAAAALRLGADGTVRLEPRGTGWRLLASLVLAALFEAEQTDIRRRLKTCHNPRCRVAFYDRSRNNSGVWHSLRVCGNAANLRAHRARRRSR